MRELNSLLRRQLKRYFGDPDTIPAEFLPFLEAVNEAYHEFDVDRGMLERSLELSSQEMLQANAEMRAVFQALPDMLFTVDEQGVILSYKAGRTDDLFFLREERILGKRIQDIPPVEVGDIIRKALEEVRIRKDLVSAEYELVLQGEVNSYEARFSPLLDGQFVVIIRNITERKKSEEALRFTHFSVDHVPQGIFWIQPEGHIINVNRYACRNLGYSRDELVGLQVQDIDPNIKPETWKETWKRLKTLGSAITHSDQRRKDGTLFPVEIHAHYLVVNDREYIFAFVRDITDLKQDEKFRELSRNILEVLNLPLERPNLIRRILELIKVSMDIESVAIRLRDGEDFPCVDAIGGSPCNHETGCLIESRRESGWFTLETEECDFPECICGRVIAGRTNSSLPFFTEYGSFWLNGNQAALPASSEVLNLGAYKEHCPRLGFENTALIPLRSGVDTIGLLELGDSRPDRLKIQAIQYIEGIGGSIGIALARNQAEDILIQSEESYRTLAENIPATVYRIHLRKGMRIQFFNDMVGVMTGHDPETLPSGSISPMDSLILPKERENVDKILKQSMIDDRPFQVEYRLMHMDGSIRNFVEYGKSVTGTDGKPLFVDGVIFDITDKKRLEAQLVQVQKMEAIGTLAGGIAHDFNNLLMGIQGYASLMLLETDPRHSHYEKLRSIEEQVKSGAGLTRQLLGFARGGKYEIKSSDLNEILEKTSSMFGRTKKEIQIQRYFQTDLWPVELDRGQIEQVLLNLYVNASQAMPAGGELQIETENLILDEKFVHPYSLTPGRYVRISVTDNGVGMDEKTLERIFDPFFTTKEMGRGTGLGLASAYGIVKGHKGIIDVYSEKGHGTTFNIFLPASDKAVKKEKTVNTDIMTGRGTILLIDDEEVILQVTREMLRRLGYRVVTARGGEEAINVLKNVGDSIDLIILDMIMPGMSGAETFDVIQGIRPGLKVILSSGYSLNEQALRILERGCKAFIQKPFTQRDLSQKIQEILPQS